MTLVAAAAGLALVLGIYSSWQGEGDDGGTADLGAIAPAAGVAIAPKPAARAPRADNAAELARGSAATAPSFDLVRIARDRQAVLAGRGPARSTITVLDGDKPIAQAVSDEHGEWVIIPDRPLAAGSRQLRLSALTPSGVRVVSDATVVVLVPESAGGGVTPVSAATPTVVSLASASRQSSRVLRRAERQKGTPSDVLSLEVIDYDEAGNVVVTGAAPAGAAVRVYLDNRPIGAVHSPDGGWRIVSTGEIAPGNYSLRIDQLAADGSVSARIEVPFTRVSAAEIMAIGPGDRVVIQPGNNLWRIARRAYGSGLLYTVIYDANAEQIRDPDLIYPGQIFTLPQTEG